MRLGRIMFVLLIGLSVAMLPVGSGISALGSVSTPQAAKSVEASPHDCCDHDDMPVGNMLKDCQAAAGCTSKCVSLYAEAFLNPVAHPPAPALECSFAVDTFHSEEGCPPFRPPRS